MALPIPLKRKLKIKKGLKNGEVVMPPIYPSKMVENRYKVELNRFVNKMIGETLSELMPVVTVAIKETKEAIKPIEDVDLLSKVSEVLTGLKLKYRKVDGVAREMASNMVMGSLRHNIKSFANKLDFVSGGVSLKRILKEGFYEPVVKSAMKTNVALIKSIPEQYFSKIEVLVYQNMTNDLNGGSLADEIMKLGKSTRNRANTIARDQTSKTNASITHVRQTGLGIKKYIWSTSEDERVRKTHKENNGKEFQWTKPNPKTGHPSDDVNCRCVALAVVNFDDL